MRNPRRIGRNTCTHICSFTHTRTHAEPGPRDGLRSRPGMRGRETPLCPRGQRLSASQAGWASASWRAERAAAPLGAHSRSAAEACGAAASCGPSPRAADVSSCLKLTRPVGKFYDSLVSRENLSFSQPAVAWLAGSGAGLAPGLTCRDVGTGTDTACCVTCHPCQLPQTRAGAAPSPGRVSESSLAR